MVLLCFFVQAATHSYTAAAAADDEDDDDDDDDDGNRCVMISVDSTDLRSKPSRYERDTSSALNVLAVNAADVAALITTCHHQQQPHQQTLDDVTHTHDVTPRDVTSSSSSDSRHDVSHDVSNDGERVAKSLTSLDDDADDVIKVTSRPVGDGRCDDVDDDVTVDDRAKAPCVHLSELAVESQNAKETESFLREMMWQIAMKRLRRGDWQKLARQLHFTDEHIAAISCQYTGLSVCLSLSLSVCLSVCVPSCRFTKCS